MQSLTDSYVLHNRVKIPCLGLGTWQTPHGQTAIDAVIHAISVGYRHIDTAADYQNEQSVGIAVKQCGVPREEIFVTSKLQNAAHGYDNTMDAFEQTMKNLDMEYLDLYQIHWPNPPKFRDRWQEANAGTWKAFEALYNANRIRAIGISNFHPQHIDELLKTATVQPMVNQIRLCPGDTQDEVVDYCRRHDILLEAYSPLGTGEIFKVPEMQALSHKYNKTVAQICIRWSLQMDFLPLPKSVMPSRIEENADVFDFSLSPQDVESIANLNGCVGYSLDPDTISF